MALFAVAVVLFSSFASLIVVARSPEVPHGPSPAFGGTVAAGKPALLSRGEPASAPPVDEVPAGGASPGSRDGSIPAEPRLSGSGSPSATTLDLLNGSIAPGISPPEQIDQVGGIAFDPMLDRVLVQGGGSGIGNSTTVLSEISPTTRAIAGELEPSGCHLSNPAVTGLVLDPNNGLAYLACGANLDTISVVDPSDGAVRATIPAGGSSVGCSGEGPTIVGLALAAGLHEVLALVLGCYVAQNHTTVLPGILTVVDDRSNTVIGSVGLGNSVREAVPLLSGGEPIAFDPASGLVYVAAKLTEMGALITAAVNPVDLQLVSTWGMGSFPVTPALVYSPALGGVVLGGATVLPHSIEPQLLFLDPRTGTVKPVVTWPALSNSSDETWISALTAGPGRDLTISLESGAGGFNATNPSDLVEVYNLTEKKWVANLSIVRPGAGVFDPTQRALFLLEPIDQQVAVVSGSPLVLSGSVPLGVRALTASFDPVSGAVYVAQSGLCGLSFFTAAPWICPKETIASVPLTTRTPGVGFPVLSGVVGSLLYDAGDQRLYALTECPIGGALECDFNNSSAALSSYTPTGERVGVTSLPYASPAWIPEAMAIDSRSNEVMVFGQEGHYDYLEFVAPSGDSIAATYRIDDPYGSIGSVAYDRIDNLAYFAARCLSGTRVDLCLWGINATTLAPQVRVQLSPPTNPYLDDAEAVAFDAANDTLYVANGSALLGISGANGSLTSELSVPGGADEVQYDPSSGSVFVLGENFSAINASTGHLLGAVALPEDIGVTGFDLAPADGQAVLWSLYNGSLFFVPIRGAPLGIGTSAPPYLVGFAESGLPSGTSWSVSFGGATSSGAGTRWFWVANGTYSYSVAPLPGYRQSTLPSVGRVTVDGGPVTMAIATYLPTVYAIQFVDTGPPDPSGWNVTLVQATGDSDHGPCTGCTETSTTRTFSGANGTYHYLIRSLGAGYVVSGRPASGTIAVNGAPLEIDLGFLSGRSPTLAFLETGLSLGSEWCVTIASALTECASTGTISFENLTPGNYTYTSFAPAGFAVRHASGGVVLGPAGKTVHRAFSDRTYPVAFSEIGLRPGTRWSVTVGGRSYARSSPFVTVDLPNGTIGFTVAPIAGYLPNGAPRNVVVSGAPRSADVGFTQIRYAVTFAESGLPSGTNWTLRISTPHHWWNGSSLLDYRFFTSNGSSPITIHLPNGSFHFRSSLVAGYRTASGNFRVSGGGASVPVLFRPRTGVMPMPSGSISAPTIARSDTGLRRPPTRGGSASDRPLPSAEA